MPLPPREERNLIRSTRATIEMREPMLVDSRTPETLRGSEPRGPLILHRERAVCERNRPGAALAPKPDHDVLMAVTRQGVLGALI